jgi:serine/threonine protein kinase
VFDPATAEVLGAGGFGIVYKGEYLSVPVAIKVLRGAALTPDVVAAFHEEAALHASLVFPHVAPLLGIVTDRVPNCMVLELMDRSLHSLVHDKTDAFPWEQRVRIALETATGLSFLHAKRILHRDLKSLNVLLTEDRKARLTDFGLAKVKLHSTNTDTTGHHPKGTLAFMAPELLKMGGKVTESSDVYAYGVTLWEMAARRNPYEDAWGHAELIRAWVIDAQREKNPEDTPPAFA